MGPTKLETIIVSSKFVSSKCELEIGQNVNEQKIE